MDLDEVRATLEARRDDTQARVATLAKRPERGASQGFGKRIGDGTIEAVSRFNEIGVGTSLETGLERTERALAKLDEGTYGMLRQLRAADRREAAARDAGRRAVHRLR